MLILALSFHRIGGYDVETDFYWNYVNSAKSFIDGNFIIDAYRGPLFPIILSIIYFIVGDFFISGILINTLTAALSLIILYKTLFKLFDPNTAFLSATLVMLNPIFVQFTYTNGTDMLFFFLSYTTLYLFFNRQHSLRSLFAISLCIVLAYLTRYNGIFLFSIILIIIFDRSELNKKKRIYDSIAIISFAFIFALPWNIYTLITKGSFFYNHNYKNIVYEYFAKGKINWDIFWESFSSTYPSVFDLVLENPILLTTHFLSNIFSHLYQDITELIGIHIGVIFIILLPIFLIKNRYKFLPISFLIIGMIYFLLLCLTFYSERFHLFLIPIYTAITIKSILLLAEYKVNLKSISFLISFIIYISLSWTLSYNIRMITFGPNEILELRDWFTLTMHQDSRTKTIASRKPHVSYYLNMNHHNLPRAIDFNEFHRKIKDLGINFLYLSEVELSTRRDLMYLIDTSKTFKGLTKLKFSERPKYILYKVE